MLRVAKQKFQSNPFPQVINHPNMFKIKKRKKEESLILTLKDPFISESCIEIKIELNFFTSSGIGTLRVKILKAKIFGEGHSVVIYTFVRLYLVEILVFIF